MLIEVSLLPIGRKQVLRNMLELYLHDFSECTTNDDHLELDEAGLYNYPYLDLYWTEAERYPYIVTVDGKLAGFCLVRILEDSTHEVAEFFVVRKYRRCGVGSAMIEQMFQLHKGVWSIDTPIKNVGAQYFWRSAVQRQAVEYSEAVVCGGQRLQWRFSNG